MQPPGPQQQPAGGAPAQPAPSNWMVPAILTTLFCCLPTGIVAIVYASQVNTKWNAGDVEGAQASANSAKTWTYVSIGIWVVLFVISIVINVVAGGMVASQGGGGY